MTPKNLKHLEAAVAEIKKAGSDVRGFLAMRDALMASEDNWKATDFYDIFLYGHKGYEAFTDEEIMKELVSRTEDLGKKDFSEFVKGMKESFKN